MKLGSGIDHRWQDKDADSPFRRWRRRLRLPTLLTVLALLAHATGLARGWVELTGLLFPVGLALVLWQSWSVRRGQRRWRRDSVLVMPELPSPVSRIPVEREWRWPSHPLVQAPLAMALIGMLYWAIVLNHLQLPVEWLLATVLLALVNLWCWREPLLLVLIVVLSVAILALLGWAVETFSVIGAMVMLAGLSAVVAIAVAEIRKRINRNTQTP